MAHTATSRPVEARQTSPAGRFDIYAGVHKGLRSFMAETLVAAGRMDVYDPAEIIGTLAQVRGLLDLCRAHLHAENQFLHPAMEARRTGTACKTATEHEDQVQALEALETGVLAVERAQPGARVDKDHDADSSLPRPSNRCRSPFCNSSCCVDRLSGLSRVSCDRVQGDNHA